MKKQYRKTRRVVIQLGKFDWGSGRMENLVEVEFGWRFLNGNGEAYFSAEGSVWNRIHTDCIEGGQCLDSIMDACRERNVAYHLFERVYDAWKKHHLKNHSYLTQEEVAHIDYLIECGLKSGGKLIEREYGE